MGHAMPFGYCFCFTLGLQVNLQAIKSHIMPFYSKTFLKIILLACLLLPSKSFLAQENNSSCCKLLLVGANASSNNGEFSYTPITSAQLRVKDKPRLLFFTFKGCTGCKILEKEVLIPSRQEIESKYGMDILAIAKLPEGEEHAIAEYYAHLPFELYLDRDDGFFIATSSPDDQSRYKYARPRLMLMTGDQEQLIIPTGMIFSKEKLFNYLDKKLTEQ